MTGDGTELTAAEQENLRLFNERQTGRRDNRGEPGNIIARYNRKNLREIMLAIDNLHSNVFSSKRVGQKIGKDARYVVRYLPHFIVCGMIKITHYSITPAGKRYNIRYRQLFDINEADEVLDKLRKNARTWDKNKYVVELNERVKKERMHEENKRVLRYF